MQPDQFRKHSHIIRASLSTITPAYDARLDLPHYRMLVPPAIEFCMRGSFRLAPEAKVKDRSHNW